MISLKNQIPFFARLQGVLACFFFVLLAGFYFLAYRPLTAEQATLAGQIAERQANLSDTADRLRVLPAVAADVRQLRSQLEGRKKLPAENDLAQFIRDITRLGDNSALKSFRYKPDASRRNEFFAQLPIQVMFEGDFVKAFSFLKQVEELERLTRVRNLQVKSRDPASGQVQVELTMNIYYAPQE